MNDHAAAPTDLDAAFFQRLYDGAGLAVFAIDTGGRILAWNPLAREVFERRAGQAAGRDVRLILPEQDRAQFDESLRELLATRDATEFRTRFDDDHACPTDYAVWLTPIFDEHGAIEAVAVWLNDITARTQLRRALRKRERLTQLGSLAGSVAHHYNNLLCSIATSLEFALNMNTMSAMRRVLRRTADAVARATKLTQQLLAFAQADYRASEEADLAEIVQDFVEQHRGSLADHGVRLRVELEPIPPLSLPREQMVLILDNLVTNAVEAMPEGGELTIALESRGDEAVALRIRDTGPGIPPENMEHLFEPFFTTKGELAAGTTRRAGMGLAVVHGLVSEMHGQIHASNVPGGGAQLEIVFALRRP